MPSSLAENKRTRPPPELMIISLQNPKIQQVKALLSRTQRRREAGAFVIEGVRLVKEAQLAGWEPDLVLYSPELSSGGERLVETYRNQGTQVEQVASQVMQALSDTETPQGILAVLPLRQLPVPDKVDFVLILDEVRDPGNLGTILRTSAAAGVQAVYLSPGTVDPFSPKVLRAGMGAHFRLPQEELLWDEIQVKTKQAGLRLLASAAGEGTVYYQADLQAPLALVIGGEAQGAGPQARRLADQFLHIPMPGGSESLNAGAAAAILLFEVVRQRGLES